MAYVKTVVLAIGLCFVANILISFGLVGVRIYREKATGIAFTHRGIVEALLASVVLGGILGTVWYGVQNLRR